MSETSPLLSTSQEQRATGDEEVTLFKEKLGERLESPTAHWTIIALTALDGAFVLCDLGYDFLKDPACTCNNSCPEDPPILEIFALLSLIITSIFLLEIPLSLYAFGLKHYTTAEHAYLHFFDAVVITATFTLELFLRGKAEEIAGLLIILRLWRLVKLVSTVGVGVTEYDDVEVHGGSSLAKENEWKKEKEGLLKEVASLRQELEAYKRGVAPAAPA